MGADSAQEPGGGACQHPTPSTHPRRPRPAAAGPVPGLDALPAESPLRAALRTEWEQLSLNGDEAPPAASGPATPPPPPRCHSWGWGGKEQVWTCCRARPAPVVDRESLSPHPEGPAAHRPHQWPPCPPEVTPTASRRLACWTTDWQAWQISSNAPRPHFTGGHWGQRGHGGAGLAQQSCGKARPPTRHPFRPRPAERGQSCSPGPSGPSPLLSPPQVWPLRLSRSLSTGVRVPT